MTASPIARSSVRQPSRSRRAATVNATRLGRKHPVSAYDPDGLARAAAPPTPLMTTWPLQDGPRLGVLVFHWPAPEWARLDSKPAGAQPNGDGSWTELRVV